MDLIMKNIHMDQIKCETQTQIALEDDINIADVKPDVYQLVTEKGELEIEQIRATEDHVQVKGCLRFCILYISDEDMHRPASMEGSISFDEKLFLKGVLPQDTVQVKSVLEDLSVGMINSRKLSVQALMRLNVWAEDTFDTSVAVGIESPEVVEVQKKAMQALNLVIQKKDIFRVKKEIELPGGMPNIFQILWKDCCLRNVSFGPGEESMRLMGELDLFFLYEGEGESRPVTWYETSLPISGTVECQGMRADMLEDINCRISHREIEVKCDEDGEERKVGLDLVLDLDMKLYEEKQMEMLADIYGVTKEVEAVRKTGNFRQLMTKNTGKCRVGGRLQAAHQTPGIQKICSADGQILMERVEQTTEGLQAFGTLEIRVLYASADTELPFYSLKGSLPFSYTLEMPQKKELDCIWRIEPALDQLQVAAADTKEAEVRAQVSLKSFIFGQSKEDIVADVEVMEHDPKRLADMPGIVAYAVRTDDTLWSIGKRYCIPVKNVKELNELIGDDVKPGDKLLIVKGS